MSVKQRDKSKKRATIIKGATQVFINDGYEIASMDKIAEAAGVSKRTVYNHFESKEILFEAIVEDILEQRSNYNQIIYKPDASLKEQLLEFAELEIFFIDTPHKLELSRFLSVTFLKNRDYQRKMTKKYPPISLMLISWLESAKADNRINAKDTMIAARVFYALVVGGITWPVLFTEGFNRSAITPLLDEAIEVFLAKYEI